MNEANIGAQKDIEAVSLLYILYSSFSLIPLSGLFYSYRGPREMPEIFWQFFPYVFGFYITVGLAGILLRCKKKIGLFIGRLVTPFIFFTFPIGTVLAVFFYLKVRKPDFKEQLN